MKKSEIENQMIENQKIMSELILNNKKLELEILFAQLKVISGQIQHHIDENNLENQFHSIIDFNEIDYNINCLRLEKGYK